MKNHLFKTGTILLIMVMSWSCTKETVQNASEKFPELKAFYNSHRPDDQNIFKNTQPLWEKVNKLSQSNFIVYEVEMLNPDKVGITSKRLTTKDIKNYWDTHTLKMLFFVDPIKNIIVKGCYMVVEATSAIDLEKVHYKQTNGLTGQVVYYNLDGTLSNGVNYANGIPVREILELSIEEVVKVKKQNNISLLNERLVVVQGCSVQYIETGYIGCVGAGDYENCKWYSTGYSSYMVCEGVQEKSVLEDYGGGGGGGGDGSTTPITDIKHKLDSFPCAKNLVSQMNNLNSDISILIKNAFNKNDRINLTIEPNYSLQGTSTDGVLGQNSKFTYNNQLYFNISVGINPDVLKNATKEYILVTIYHEAIHAYLALKKAELSETEFNNQFAGLYVNGGRLIGVQDPQHWSMGYTNFVNGLKNIILAYNPSFNADRAHALALGGIVSLTPEQAAINQQEKNTTIFGYTGTKCP